MSNNIIEVAFGQQERTEETFSLVARKINGEWHVDIIDHHRGSNAPKPDTVFRRIASSLLQIAGGLSQSAEDIEKSERGPMVGAVAIYANGTYEYSGDEVWKTPEAAGWFRKRMHVVINDILTRK